MLVDGCENNTNLTKKSEKKSWQKIWKNHNFLVKFDIYCLNSIYTTLYIVGTQFYTIYGGAAHHQHGVHDFSIESFYALISVE
jgi:hypothetical protein